MQPQALAELARGVHALGKNVVCYTGYTLEELRQQEEAACLLQETDILIDGPFVQEQMDLTLKFRGSANQRIIKMTENAD